MKLFISLILLHCVIGAEYKRRPHLSLEVKTKHNNIKDDQAQHLLHSLNIIVKSWMVTDLSLHRMAENIVQSILPYAFTILTTSELSSDCSRDMVNYLRGIAETKTWAFQMVDSYGKLPSGIISGTVSSLGAYETCLNVTAPNMFIGKYCLVDFDIPLPEQGYFHLWEQEIPRIFNLSHNDTIVHEFLKWGERLYMLHPRTAVCIPSSCTDSDAQILARKAMQLTGLGFNTNVKSCDTRNDVVDVTLFDLMLMLVLAIIVSTVLLGTILDFFYKMTTDNSKDEEDLNCRNCLLYFSFLRNTERLFKKDDSPDSIRIFHGLRVISMCWLILNHTGFMEHPQAYGGLKAYFEDISSFWLQFCSCLLAVETFFFMSATLLAYNIVKVSEQKLTIGLLFIKRYFRTTVPHILMIAVTCLLPFVGSGPLYKDIIGKEAQNCKERGWLNLLYVNNFVNFQQMCMGSTWYLSVDTQLFLAAILIIVPLRNNNRTAIVSIVALMIFGVLGTIVSQIVYNLPPTMLQINHQMEYVSDVWQKSYFMPHFHLPAYCIGLLVGYYLAISKYVRVSLRVNITLWAAALFVQFFVVFYPYVWNKGMDYPGMLSSVLYGCTHRILWALSLAWITIACQSNHGGIIAKFLGSEAFVPLSRLTFLAYLTNFTIKFLYIGSATNVIIYSCGATINMFLSIVAITFVVSFILTLIIEAPFMTLEKAVMIKLRERKRGKGK